jgi:hypothetical protein
MANLSGSAMANPGKNEPAEGSLRTPDKRQHSDRFINDAAVMMILSK